MNKNENQIHYINIKLIKESPTNPRKYYDKQSLEELALSIKETGVRQAVLLRPIKDPKYKYELVYGSRRFKSSKIAGMETIKAEIENLSDEMTIEVQTIENLQREDIHPIDESDSYNMLLKKGLTVQVISKKIGKTIDYVYKRLRLAGMIHIIKEYGYKGLIPTSYLIIIAAQTPYNQELIYKFLKNNNKEIDPDDFPTYGDLQDFVSTELEMNLARFSFDQKDDKLLKGVPACTACPKNKSNDILLFGKSDAVCTDGTCRELKLITHVKNLLDKNPNYYIIAENYEHQVSNVIKKSFPKIHFYYSNDFRTSAPGCKSVARGILIANKYNDNTKLGAVRNICVDKTCKKCYPKESSGSSSAYTPAETKAKKEYNDKRKIIMQELNLSRKELFIETVKMFKAFDNNFLFDLADHLKADSLNMLQVEAFKGLTANFRKPDKPLGRYETINIKESEVISGKLSTYDLQLLIFSDYIDHMINFDTWQSFEQHKNTIGTDNDHLHTWAVKLLGEKKVNEIIAKHKVKQPEKKEKKSKTKKK